MYNVYIEKKLIASFVRLKDARSYVNHFFVNDFSKKGYSLVCVNFPRRPDPYKYTFGRCGSYIVVSIYTVL